MLSISEATEKYKDDIFRVAFSFLKSADLSDDVVHLYYFEGNSVN